MAQQPTPVASPVTDAAQLATLTRINTDDLLAAVGLAHIRRGRRLLDVLCHAPAQRFARQVVAYDTIVGRHGSLLKPLPQTMLANFSPALLEGLMTLGDEMPMEYASSIAFDCVRAGA